MSIDENIIEEIKQNSYLVKLYKALTLLEEVDKEHNLLLVRMRLEEAILDELGYAEDFNTHELIKIKRR